MSRSVGNTSLCFRFRERAPISSRLNAIDLYLVVCIFLVFGALMEYAVILLLLKKRRKPKYTIDSGLKKMFSNNGDVTAQAPGAVAQKIIQIVVELDMPMSAYVVQVYYILATSEASTNLSRFDGIRYGHRSTSEAHELIELYTASRGEGRRCSATALAIALSCRLHELDDQGPNHGSDHGPDRRPARGGDR